MKLVDWSIQGTEFSHCNCNWGCPCQFNGDPSHGNCRAYCFVQVDRGRFGDVSLDGLDWGVMFSWPGAIHEGHGTCQSIIDERSAPEQRAALEAISHGRETEPGRLIWQIFSTTVENVLPTLYLPIDLRIDLAGRAAEVNVPGLIAGQAGPITHEKFSGGHHVRMILPNGFEFTEAEFVSGKSTGTAALDLSFQDTHAHLARIHWSTHGVVRSRSTP
jgi:hypothetical protein